MAEITKYEEKSNLSTTSNIKKRKVSDYFSLNPIKKKKLSHETNVSTLNITSEILSTHISTPIKWKKIEKEGLDLDYAVLFPPKMADQLFDRLEKEIDYYTGDLTKIRVFGKWHQIPRKQVAYGDDGLTYSFSGNSFPARPWTDLLIAIRDTIYGVTGRRFNFVLVNRYKDGNDYIGEHRDDEKELDIASPIASLSLGQQRDFVLRHQNSRNSNARCHSGVEPPKNETVLLQHGSLLMMNPPTNKYWYHSLPKRARLLNPRINLTFRLMVNAKK